MAVSRFKTIRNFHPLNEQELQWHGIDVNKHPKDHLEVEFLWENADFLWEMQGHRYYAKNDGRVIMVEGKKYHSTKEMTFNDCQELLREITQGYDMHDVWVGTQDLAVIQGFSGKKEEEIVDCINNILSLLDKLGYSAIVIRNIECKMKDEEMSQYPIVDLQKDFFDMCILVVNPNAKETFLQDCFQLTGQHNLSFIFNQKKRREAVIYKNSSLSNQFQSTLIPSCSWFYLINAEMYYDGKFYEFRYGYGGGSYQDCSSKSYVFFPESI